MNKFITALSFSLLCLFRIVYAGDESMFSLSTDYTYANLVATQQLLVNQNFGNSWNTPSNVHYSPPSESFNRVVLELTVNSTGSNYDRLGQLFIDNIEIWRTSTAEPDNSGASWSVRKDVSHYASLFKNDRTVNFLIRNRVTDEFTGIFYVTLTAYYYQDSSSTSVTEDSWAVDINNSPSSIQALTKSTDAASSWSAPDDDISISVGPLDRSTNRALVHIFASGNGDDEFWWDSAHNNSDSGPSRFVDVYVGGQLAGFAAPYPVIYTGGVNPLLWRPLVDVRTYDIPAYFVDITPFLPSLWNEATDIELKVTNGINNEDIPSNWVVNYNLFLWSTEGQSNSGTQHTPEAHSTNDGVNSEVVVNRNVTTSASLTIGGQQHDVQWQQDVSFNNTLEISSSSNSHVWQDTLGTASISGLYDFDISFDYPFQCEMDVGSYFRVQQALKSDISSSNYYTWIDSSVNLVNGNYQNGKSSQWLSFPGGSHYASTEDLQLLQRW